MSNVSEAQISVLVYQSVADRLRVAYVQKGKRSIAKEVRDMIQFVLLLEDQGIDWESMLQAYERAEKLEAQRLKKIQGMNRLAETLGHKGAVWWA